MEKTYISKKELIAKLKISTRTFQRWQKMGLNIVKVGRTVLIEECDLDAFLQSYKIENS